MVRFTRRTLLQSAALSSVGLPILSSSGVATDISFEGGTGSEEYPYMIATAEQLQAIAEELDAHYTLVDDIDVSSLEFDPIGEFGTDRDDWFSGSFSGNGYRIEGLAIDLPGENGVGLFAAIDPSGTVTNVSITDADINGNEAVGVLVGGNLGDITSVFVDGTVSGDRSVGGIAGGNAGTIDHSSADVNAQCTYYGGGIVGENGIEAQDVELSGTVSRCIATGTVSTVDDSGDPLGIGGTVGLNTVESTVERSYTDVALDGGSEVGGLVGIHEGDSLIERSYAVGSIDGTADTGGLVGFLSESAVEDSYWDRETTGQPSSPGISDDNGLSTDEMTGDGAVDHLDGFDFEATWETTDSYPVLAWEQDDPPAPKGLVSVEDQTIGEPSITVSSVWTSVDSVLETLQAEDDDVLADPLELPAGSSESDLSVDLTDAVDADTTVQLRLLDATTDLVVDTSEAIISPEEDPASFAVDILATNSPVAADEVLEVSVEIENTADQSGSDTIELLDFDGAVVSDSPVELAGGDSTVLTLSWAVTADDVGTDTVIVRSDDNADTIEVTVEEREVPYVSIDDQETAGDTIEVASAFNPDEDYVVVLHIDDDEEPESVGDVIGVSDTIAGGTEVTGLSIDLEYRLDEEQTITAMLYLAAE